MKSTYAYLQMLQLLSKDELEMFKHYLAAKYCHTNENAKKLFDILYPDNSLELAPQFLRKKGKAEADFSWKKNPFKEKEELKREFFPLIFEKEYTKDKTGLDVLMTSSKALLEDFLVLEELKKDKELYYITLLNIFKYKSGFDEFYQAKANHIKSKYWIKNEQIRSIKQLDFHFFYSQIDYGYKIASGKADVESKDSFSKVLEGLNLYVITLYLKYSAEVLNRAEIFNEEEITSENRHTYLLEGVLKLVANKRNFYHVPIIFLYYHLVRCLLFARKARGLVLGSVQRSLLEKKELYCYVQMKTFFLKQISLQEKEVKKFESADDLENIYDAISNYQIRKMDKEPCLMEDWSELTSAALRHNLINFRGGRYIRIMRRALKIILHYYVTQKPEAAILVKKEMANFMEQNKSYISKDENIETTAFVRGLELVYEIKVDKKLREECAKIARTLNLSGKTLLAELARRILLIQLFYRANLPTEELTRCIASARTFINDHKEINAIKREAHLAFIRCVTNMDNYRYGMAKDKQRLFSKIEKEIKQQSAPLEREWLMNELSYL